MSLSVKFTVTASSQADVVLQLAPLLTVLGEQVVLPSLEVHADSATVFAEWDSVEDFAEQLGAALAIE